MIGIVIVAHGGLAQELLAATVHVVGPQQAFAAISIGPEDDRAERQREICDIADSVDTGAGVVVVTDMFGGSPSNLSLKACNPENRKILTGVNLPMLIKLASMRDAETLAEAAAAAEQAGRKYIRIASKLMEGDH